MNGEADHEFWVERERQLERQAAEAEPVDTPVVIPEQVAIQAPVWTRENVLDFIRKQASNSTPAK